MNGTREELDWTQRKEKTRLPFAFHQSNVSLHACLNHFQKLE